MNRDRLIQMLLERTDVKPDEAEYLVNNCIERYCEMGDSFICIINVRGVRQVHGYNFSRIHAVKAFRAVTEFLRSENGELYTTVKEGNYITNRFVNRLGFRTFNTIGGYNIMRRSYAK